LSYEKRCALLEATVCSTGLESGEVVRGDGEHDAIMTATPARISMVVSWSIKRSTQLDHHTSTTVRRMT
jgi:hypothetical protein